MIELKLTTGEEQLLTPIKNDKGQYELVDSTNTVQMVVILKDAHIDIINKGNVDVEAYDQQDLSSRFDLLAVEILEKEQSGVEQNEYDEKVEITPYDPELIKVHQKQFSIKLIDEMIENGDIDFTPDFQRHFVWNSIQKSKLIESLLLRIPLPLFYFAEDYEGRLTIVDGLQRLTTIKEFMRNEFPLKNLEYLDEGVKGRYYKTNLEKGQQGIDPKYYRWFNMTQFAVNVIDPSSPFKVKYDIFRRINTGGRPLKNQEIRNCLSSISLRKLLNEMIALNEFKRATSSSVKPDRMEDQEVALRFITFYDAFKQDASLQTSYSGYMENTLDEATEHYYKINENTHKKYLELFRNAMKNAEYLFGSRYAFRKVRKEHIGDARKQLFNKALFVAWATQLAEIPYDKITEKYPKEYLLPIFAEKLERDDDLMYYLSYGTNGKANLMYVFRVVAELINEKLTL